MSVYVNGTTGPWHADDSGVRADGVYENSIMHLGPPSVDGTRATNTLEPSRNVAGLVGGERVTGRVRVTE